MAQDKPPPKKPSSLPVSKPPPVVEESIELEEAPPSTGGISTVIGVPALADPKKGTPPTPLVEHKATLLGIPAPLAPSEPPAPPPPAPLPSEPPPPPEGIAAIAEKKWRELRDGPRPRLIAFAVMGGLVVLIFLGVLVRLATAPSKDADVPVASATASVAPPATSEAPVTPPPPVAAPKAVVCTVARESRVVAPRAIVSAGVEVVALDGSIAIGWASGPKEATIALLDPSAATTSTKKIAAQGTVRRVTPKAPADKSAIDIDPSARSIGAYDIGASGGELVWAAHGSKETKPLWKLETDGAVEALRGHATADGIVVAYRHNGAIWAGAAKGEGSVPTRVAGLGPQLGSPAIAVNDGKVLVAWADRSEATQPWGLRMFSWTLGEAPKPAQAFTLPSGGLGEHAMAPSITPLANGGFLMVWTEGPISKQQVRAQVLAADGSMSGDAMTVSADGVHAGQAQVALLPDGSGIVAFLADAGKAFELRATTIRCN